MNSIAREAGNSTKNQKYLILTGIFLISFSGLMFEILLTRIFSTIIWYHYAFIAVSVALFGLSFGGVLGHFLAKKYDLLSLVTGAALSLSISLPVCLCLLLRLPMSPSALILYYSVAMIPFFLIGVSVSSVFQGFGKTAHFLYFADLVGASFGCLLANQILIIFGAESAVLFIGVIGATSAMLFALASKKTKLAAVGIIVLILSSSVFTSNLHNPTITITNAPSKSLFQELHNNPSSHLVFTAWNSFSRVDVLEGESYPVLAHIFIDADAGTNVLRWNGSLEDAQYLKQMIYYGPYEIAKEPRTTLVIGSGGGADIVAALVGGSSRVVAVEINPIIVQVVRSYGNLAGNIYDRAEVETVIDEGRSYISRSNDKYDVVVLTMVDSWAALASGGYSLSENYLYTTEAFEAYFNHLSEDGVLSITRWGGEVPKLVTTALKMMELEGIPPTEGAEHIMITNWEYEPGRNVTLFMLKKTPFSPLQAKIMLNKTLELGPDNEPFYIPFLCSEEPYSLLFNGTVSLEDFCSLYRRRITPATDDSPFFFCFNKFLPQNLITLIVFASVVVLGTVSIPFLKKRYLASAAQKAPFIIYFAALGVGYMLVEVVLIQKILLFLGEPTLALSIALFALLLSSGIGSIVSGLVKRDSMTKILVAGTAIVLMAVIYFLVLNLLSTVLLTQSNTVRIAAAILLIFPLGFFMGMPFPTGINYTSSRMQISISWVWAINGATSVLGSVLATSTGLVAGFNYALLVAAACYFAAVVCALYWKNVWLFRRLQGVLR